MKPSDKYKMICPNYKTCDRTLRVIPLKKMTTENDKRYKWWKCQKCHTLILIPVEGN